MADPEFRRWRYYAPASLKRQAYELVKRIRKSKEVGRTWAERV
jgi:hypothetical protein